MGEEGDGIMANMLGKGEKGRERRGERIWLEFFEVVFFFFSFMGFSDHFFFVTRVFASERILRFFATTCFRMYDYGSVLGERSEGVHGLYHLLAFMNVCAI